MMGQNDRITLVYGDIGNRLFDEIKSDFPSRIINFGISEPSMVSFAAGLASSGKIPFVYTINSFLYLKAMEQIKLDLCYSGHRAVLVGTGSGLSYSALGTSHHSLEDIGMLSTIPNLELFAPADSVELSLSMRWGAGAEGPSYIRIGKKGEPRLHDDLEAKSSGIGPFLFWGKLENPTVILIGCGPIVAEALAAQQKIESSGLGCVTFSVPHLSVAAQAFVMPEGLSPSVVCVIEEHGSNGGLFSILREKLWNVERQHGASILSINTGHEFQTGLGNRNQALKLLGMDAQSISAAVFRALRKV